MDKTPAFIKAFLLAAILIVALIGCATRTIPPASLAVSLDKAELYFTVKHLTGIRPPRNYQNIDSLNNAAAFIKNKFIEYGYTPVEQPYTIENVEYKNIIASYGPAGAPRFIVGAHYDVCGDQPGADDNASGVAGLLELASLFRKYSPQLNFRIDFVAYTLEEPPFFRTDGMGSYVHAKSLYDNKVDVLGMAVLEMIGFFSDASGSQEYPLPLMGLFYRDKADFIAIVGNYGSSQLVKHFYNNVKLASLPVESLTAPASVFGVDLSDHLNYWKFGYNAVMVTDTSFFRSPNYHTGSDSLETLNFDKMQEVVRGVYGALINLQTTKGGKK